MEIKLKQNSNLVIKNHNGEPLCTVDEATGDVSGIFTEKLRNNIEEDIIDDGTTLSIIIRSFNDIFPSALTLESIRDESLNLGFNLDIDFGFISQAGYSGYGIIGITSNEDEINPSISYFDFYKERLCSIFSFNIKINNGDVINIDDFNHINYSQGICVWFPED